MVTKTCTGCGETKPLDRFSKEKRREDNRRSRCKSCDAEYKRRYRAENRDKLAEYQRRYDAENRDKVVERRRRYVEKNRDKIAERRRRYEAENRDKIAEYQRRYYEENRDRIAERERRYREENRDKLAERQRRYAEKNPDKIAERKRRYVEKNRGFINTEAANRMRETRELARMFVTVPPGTRFSPEEDAYLMEDNGMTTYQKAVHLGRPFDSCEVRIRRLRKKLTA